jgi:hypothetical protein
VPCGIIEHRFANPDAPLMSVGDGGVKKPLDALPSAARLARADT